MINTKKDDKPADFEKTIREYLRQAREKLKNDLVGTREAIGMIAAEKTRYFVEAMDVGLNADEKDFLSKLVISSMYQSFCYGYGIGKIEEKTQTRIYL